MLAVSLLYFKDFWKLVLVLTTDIQERPQNSYTTLCNGVVSHGVPFGGLRILADPARKRKRKTNLFAIFALYVTFYVCLSSRSHRSRCRWHTYLTNNGQFDYGQNPKTLNFVLEARAGIKMAQVLGSPLYICVLNILFLLSKIFLERVK